MKPLLTIDGNRFADFDGFAREVRTQLLRGEWFGGNLDAFNATSSAADSELRTANSCSAG